MKEPLFYRTLITFTDFHAEDNYFLVTIPGWDGGRKKVTVFGDALRTEVKQAVLECFKSHDEVISFAEVTIGVDKASEVQCRDFELPPNQEPPTWEEIMSRSSNI